MNHPRWFIALLSPPPIASAVDTLARESCRHWGDGRALRSPPHVTLIPPFRRSRDAIAPVQTWLRSMAQGCQPFEMTWGGWDCFAPRVIYLAVPPTEPLQRLRHQLMDGIRDEFAIDHPRDRDRPFCPHVTLAYAGRKHHDFEHLWHTMPKEPFSATFTARSLTLLRDDGHGWDVDGHYPFATEIAEP
ncbi:MAG: 2'-5' RNA ligase family protein [Cyanophyceae cyanobacterium]